MKSLTCALSPSVRLHALGRQVLHIALSAFMVLPALVQSTVGQGLEEVHFRQVVTTPSGTALGGNVDLTLRSDGSYTAHFHMHDSGAVDYDFVVRAVFGASNGTAFALQHSGGVEGTESTTLTRSPRRDSDKDIAGFHQFIKNNWPAVKAGKMSVSKDYSKAGVIGFIEDLSKVVLDITKGAARGAVGAVIALGDEMVQAFDSLEFAGSIGVIAGVAVIASGGGLVLAVTTGVQAGLMTKALIKYRPLTAQEFDFADKVFKGTLPPAQNILLTSLENLEGRAFTMPGGGNKIYINIGKYAYDHPLTHVRSEGDTPGQLFIHELTHVWQIHHKTFVPGWVCEGLITQIGNIVSSAYEYKSKGFLPWSEFGIEQQGSIVDDWFARMQTRAASKMNPEDPTDPYFRYIRDNVRVAPTVVSGAWEDSVGGVLQRGQLRTRVQIDSMSLEDRRNTLITELANRTKDAVSYYQSLNDTNLAGAGALLVFLRETRSRTDQQIKTMSADDMRNTVIVEVNVRTGRSIRDLQALSNLQVANSFTTSGPSVAPVQAFEGGWHTVTNQNGHYTLILRITNPGRNPLLYETYITGQFINTDGATKYNGILQGTIPKGTRTLIYSYTQSEIKASGKGQFTLSNDGNAITGNGTADGATFTWNGTRAKPPSIIASQPILQPAFVSVYLAWDGTPDHPNAEVWVSVNGQAEIPAATLYGDVFKQPKIASFELRLQRGSGVYKYVLKDRGNTLASVVVPVPY